MMIVIASVAVAIVAFIMYALDRRSKNEPIVWEQALKLSMFGGLITSGVVFATGTDTLSIPDVAKTVTETASTVIPEAQEMFTGVPTF
jgi:hypothetical protein